MIADSKKKVMLHLQVAKKHDKIGSKMKGIRLR